MEALLEADGEAGEFLETPTDVDTTVPDVGSTDPADEVGKRFGPYRLERLIEHGGMGSVYEAVRADDAYRRRVAIKLLNPGMLSATLVSRFQGERQILASLDHPSIARLLDGGSASDGRPYLVMEYIDGTPIDEYCDRERLPVRGRLELFRQVCEAAHYAHQNLVVHRDIKPSNILVTADGVPRLLDFGIAKLLDPETFPYTVQATIPGLQPMTPQYASPEQIRGRAITTSSDVYSLGVLLYLLLSGRLPYRLAGLPPAELDRMVSEREPSRPSAVAGRRQLRRRLAGDLDNIVLMALRKEPSRRYASAAELGEDLRHHLDGLPVQAGHGTVSYRVGKFLRRNKLTVGVVALFLALVLAFAGAMARQARQTALQRDLAEVERDKAEQVSRFLVDLFREVDPIKAKGGIITTPEALRRGAEKVDRELGEQPDVRARLLDAIGTVYVHMGLFDKAAPLLERALEIRRLRRDPEHLDVAESLDHVGALYLKQGKYAEAEPLLWRALEIRERSFPPGHSELAVSLRNLAILHRGRGEYMDAEALGQRALETFRRALGPDDPGVALSLRVLAGTYARWGEAGKAEQLIEQVLAIDEAAFGELHSATAGNLYNLGVLRLRGGQYPAGEKLFERSLAIWEGLLEEGHPRIADALAGLGRAAKQQHRYGEAEERLRRALAVYRESLGDSHPMTANCMFELGDVILRQDRPGEAEPFLQRSLEIREQALGREHPMYAESLRGLGDLRRRQGRLREAEELYRRGLVIWEEHPRIKEMTEDIPKAYTALLRALGRGAEAEALETRVAKIMAGKKVG